ncbi:MAG TPA: ARMT1-like domain-containing protein [Tenuifilaceae bacterium]|nr:ARMT1-like domain-containing protein [Tenuifilaceae bacterium]
MAMAATSITTTMETATKTDINIQSQCYGCFLKTYQRLFEKFKLTQEQQDEFLDFFHNTLEKFKNSTSPEVQRELNQGFSKIVGIEDLFEDEKINSNSIALGLYNDWSTQVPISKNPFDLALKLSIAGNIMDYGANNNFDIKSTIRRVIFAEFAINHSKQLQDKIKEAKSILYLADNAGEILFDKLFIETINHPNITYAVRSGFALNDATLHDAIDVGMNSVARVIENGFDAPATVLAKCSSEFMEVYNSADLVISKGQGNLEGLINENDPRIFFLLMVKCDVMANLLNVAKGSFIVYNPTKLD